MVYLAKQIADELQDVFVAREDEFNTTVVKEEYKKVPKVTYPKVIVGETNNSEVQERRTTDGERTTAVTLQITTYSRDMQDYDNIDSARKMMDIVDDYIQENYKMFRLGDRVVIPYLLDNTVMTCTQRYSCVYDKETQLIYTN